MIKLEISGFAKCDRKDCFACVNETCRVLYRNDFATGECPFFKPKGKENEKWQEKQK